LSKGRDAVRKISVLLVDDHAVVRASIRHILKSAADIQVVGEACDGAEALRKACQLMPDVMLLDMELPGLDGIEVIRQLHSARLPVRVLALSAYQDQQFVSELFSNQVAGYLPKEKAPGKMIDTIRRVAWKDRDRRSVTRNGDQRRRTSSHAIRD
jgi:DNA-binding NarL/FixJ family response regulator